MPLTKLDHSTLLNFKATQFHCYKKIYCILSITHKLLGRICIKIYYRTLKYLLKKVLLLQCFKRNVNKCKQCSPFAVKHNTKICYWFLGNLDYFPFWNKISVLITIHYLIVLQSSFLHAKMAVCYQSILSKFPILFIDRSISAKAGQYLELLTRLFWGCDQSRCVYL